VIVKNTRTKPRRRSSPATPETVGSRGKSTTAPPPAGLSVEQAAERLVRYREIIARTVGGAVLTEAQSDEALRILAELELPALCLSRDVSAARAFRVATTDYQKLELLWLYPHLFADRRQWAELRHRERVARREALAKLRESKTPPK